MRKIVALYLVFSVILISCGFAESILPKLSAPVSEEEVNKEALSMPSLEQVSWYNSDNITKSDDGRLAYHYSNVSENAYQKLGIAMAEAGYLLKSNSTDDNGYMVFVVGDNDDHEMELIYHEVGGDMDILYPENAVLVERDEEALTCHLQLGEPFKETEECIYSLNYARPISSYRHEYQTGYVVLIRDSETRESSDTCQFIMLGYACKNKAVYNIAAEDNKFYYGKLEYDTETVELNKTREGTSDEDFSYVCSYGTPWVDGSSTRYYAEPLYFDPSVCAVPFQFAVTFLSSDKTIKYSYDISIDETKLPESN